jgi:hypothetical protein
MLVNETVTISYSEIAHRLDFRYIEDQFLLDHQYCTVHSAKFLTPYVPSVRERHKLIRRKISDKDG